MSAPERPLVTVYSDTICPFCYIGKRRLDQLAEHHAFDVEWVPFELHPEIPPEGVPVEALGAVRLARLRREIARIGEEVGLEFAHPKVLPNSQRSLELLEFARDEGVRGDVAHEAVFSAYFREGRDIGDPGVLVAIAEALGLDGRAAAEALETRAYQSALTRGRERGMDAMVSAVPTFFFGTRIVWGAQPLAVFERALALAGADREAGA
ncbi:MAG: DsbA family oxidoreductase [Myxococcales bacterium]|nr:DsbA family oxidoreductase [Myxococcales bacterium]